MVSTLSGPIAPHPYYDKSDSSTYLSIPAPRVRPEAQEYAQRGHQGTLGLLLEIEGHSVPSTFKKTKPEPKDHFRDNIRRIRQLQKANQKKEEELKQPVKALWKSSKYDHVTSKMKEDLERPPAAPRPSSANYLRAHSRSGYIQTDRPSSSCSNVSDVNKDKPATARELRLVRRDIDFIKVNGMNAKRPVLKRSPSMTALDDLKKQQEQNMNTYRKGTVPKYLQERKKQWETEEKERVAGQPDPEMPPGHRLMSEEERRETLNKIKQKQQELTRELSAMPVRNDTIRIRKRKEEIEDKLAKIEEAIKIFSRPKVFVKLDA